MTRNQVDFIDMLAYVFFFVSGLLQVIEFQNGGEIVSTLTTVLWSFSHNGWTTEITLPLLVSLAALGVVLYTNEWYRSEQSVIQFGLFIVTLWLILSPPFVPLMAAVIESSALVGIGAVVVESAGFLSISYIG